MYILIERVRKKEHKHLNGQVFIVEEIKYKDDKTVYKIRDGKYVRYISHLFVKQLSAEGADNIINVNFRRVA